MENQELNYVKRTNKTRGGVAIYVQESLKYEVTKHFNCSGWFAGVHHN